MFFSKLTNNKSLENWFLTKCLSNKNIRTDKEVLYLNYQIYSNHTKVESPNTFEQFLKNNHVDTHNDNYYYGIGLRI